MINVVVMVNSLELSQIKEIVKAIAFFMTLLLLSILFLEEKYYFYFIPLWFYVFYHFTYKHAKK